MSDVLAIDVALVPVSPSRERLVEISNKLEREGILPRLNLGVTTRVPHITIGMGLVAMDAIALLLQQFDGTRLEVKVDGQYEVVRDFGKTQYLDIQLSPELQALHQEVMICLANHSLHAESPLFAESVEERTINYVRNFGDYAGQHFSPHITLGYGGHSECSIESLACEMGIYQLGNHCTCHTRIVT